MKTSSQLLFSFLGSSQIYISFEERRLLLILYDLANKNLNVKQSKEDVPGGLSPFITVLKSLLQATVEFVSIFQRPEKKGFLKGGEKSDPPSTDHTKSKPAVTFKFITLSLNFNTLTVVFSHVGLYVTSDPDGPLRTETCSLLGTPAH